MAEGQRDYVEVELESPALPGDDVQLALLEGKEEISRPFHLDLEIVVTEQELDVDALLGAEASVRIGRGGDPVRTVHGIVSRVEDLLHKSEEGVTRYRLSIVPRLHRLTLTLTQEVFLAQSVPQIIEAKLLRAGLLPRDFEFRLGDTYPQREFVVQYRESDLAFVSRLAESAGIAFHFEHTSGRDVVVFADAPAAFSPIASGDPLPFVAHRAEPGVHRIGRVRAMFPSTYTVVDYNEQHPALDITSKVPTSSRSGGTWVDYGAFHASPDEGKRMAQVRAQELVTANDSYEGEGVCPEVEAGKTFALAGLPRLEGTRLLVTEVTHRLVQTVLVHGRDDDGARTYENRFRAVPAERAYRPPRVTPRPRIHGFIHAVTQAAPSAATKRVAHLDAQGRYIVKFKFDDTENDTRPASSLPVRMMQPHAGSNYGMHFPLKPDVEVLIAFIDGDPDRPIIAGAVPNPVTPSPVTSKNPLMNKIVTESGLFIMMKDGG